MSQMETVKARSPRRGPIPADQTLPWFILAETGSVLLWKIELAEGGIKWVDEDGDTVSEGTRLRRVERVSKVALQELVEVVNTGDVAPVFEESLTWLQGIHTEDFTRPGTGGDVLIPEMVYAFVDEDAEGNRTPFLSDQADFEGWLLEGNDDPNPPLPEPLPEPSSNGTPLKEDALYKPGMKRQPMLKVLKSLGVEGDLINFYVTDHARRALEALDRGDQEEFDAVKVEVEVRRTQKLEEKRAVETEVTPPVVEEKEPEQEVVQVVQVVQEEVEAVIPSPQEVVQEEVEVVIPSPQEMSPELPISLSPTELIRWAKGCDWEWMVTREELEAKPISSSDTDLIAAIYGVEKEVDLLAYLTERFGPEVGAKVMEGGEFRGGRIPGMVEMLERLGLIRR